MNIDYKGNKAALAETADKDAKTREIVKEYLSRSGMTTEDFAKRIGYSQDTMRKFLGDRYHNVGRSTIHITNAALDFMEKHPIAPPTKVYGELYETANVRTIRDTFQKLLPRPVAYMLYAPPGSQKTFVLQHEVARLNRDELHLNGHGRRAYYVYARQNIRPRDMMKRIALACGSRTHGEIDHMLMNLRYEFANRRVLLTIDEAQHLSHDCFETLRELLDQPPYFSLLMAGSHHLPKIFDDLSHRFEQWNSRIIAKVRLPGLQREEGRAIVRREIGDILGDHKDADQRRLIDSLIDAATVKDAYADNEPYINVRTLTNSLDQIKSAAATKAAQAQEAAPEEALV